MGVIDDLRDKKAESSGFGEYCGSAFTVFGGSGGCCSRKPVITLLTLVLIAGPIAEVIVGSLNLNECPAQHYVPVYTLVIGAISIVSSTLDGAVRCVQDGKAADSGEMSLKMKITKGVQLLVLLLMISWFIAGNVWVFTIGPLCTDIQLISNMTSQCFSMNDTYMGEAFYCYETIFTFAYIGVYVRWSLLALAVLFCNVVCCSVCCVYCCSSAGVNTKPLLPEPLRYNDL